MSSPFEALRAGAEECLSELQLDLHSKRATSAAEAARADTHLATCARCRAGLETRRQGFAAFPGFDERQVLAAIRRQAPAPKTGGGRALVWLRRLLGPVAVVGAAAVALVVVRPSAPTALRTKGDPGLDLYRYTDGRGVPVSSGERFHEGDRLRFAVDLPAAGEVRILDVDPSGRMSTAWPLDAGATTSLGPGRHILLPGAVVLDGAVGTELLWLVVCPDAASTARCAPTPSHKPACPAACALSGFELVKEAR